MAHEIEIRAVLTEQKYEELKKLLPQKFKQVNNDTITTVRFRPKDVRVKYSNKGCEFVCKDEDVMKFSRNELTVKLSSEKDGKAMEEALKRLGFNHDPPWIKEEHDFVCEFEGNKYSLCLQHIRNFAYVLEAEIVCEDNEEEKHVPVLKKLLSSLGCEPIGIQEYRAMINDYIKKNENRS